MTLEGSDEFPIGLTIEVETPRGPVRVQTSLDATVGEFVTQATAAKSIPGPAAYELRVPMPSEDGIIWQHVEDSEKLLDALRGVQNPPRIIEQGDQV